MPDKDPRKHKLKLVQGGLTPEREETNQQMDELSERVIERQRRSIQTRLKSRIAAELCYHAGGCKRIAENVKTDQLPPYVREAIEELVESVQKYLNEGF